MMNPITTLLENPRVYRISQKLLLSGGDRPIREFLRSSLPGGGDCDVLDVGCGSQDHSRLIEGRYTGVDINPAYIEYCSKRYPGRYLTMDATDLEFEDASFDAVFNVGLCHHLSRDQVELGFSEWRRVLRPGGTLVIVDAISPLKKTNWMGWTLRKLDRGGHIVSWEEWRRMFEEFGARPSELSTFSSFPFDFAALQSIIPKNDPAEPSDRPLVSSSPSG